MAKKLFDLNISEISLVDKPANKRKLLVIKAAKSEATPDLIEKQMHVEKEGEKFCLYDGDKKMGTYDSMDEAQAAMKTNSETNKGAIMLTKEQIAKISDTKIQEAAVAQQEEIVALQKRKTELEAEVATLKGGGGSTPNDEEIWKNVPPAIRNRFEAMEKEKKEAEGRAEQERDNRNISNWIEKSKSFSYLQLVPQQFGKVMNNLQKACPDDVAEIERILTVAQDTIAKGAVFMELGRSNGGSRVVDATNMSARVDALADDFMKMDGKLSKSQAIQKVFTDHPEWYAPYSRENSVRV